MQINTTINGSVLVLALEGKLDALTSAELEKTLKNLPKEIDSLVLDFSKMDYVSSAGLRALLSAHERMSAQGGMKVTNVNAGVMSTLEMTGFTNILSISK